LMRGIHNLRYGSLLSQGQAWTPAFAGVTEKWVFQRSQQVGLQLIDRLAEYTEFHLEARYPGEKKDSYQKFTEELARQKFNEMEDA